MGNAMSSSVVEAASPGQSAWVLVVVEAKVRGFRNALCFKRWCRRHNVTVLADGKMRWVRRTEIDRALDALAAPANDNVAVRDAVLRLTGGGR